MELKQIEYFLEVARTGSFNKAAQSLFVSQPNLSYAIKSLEAELGSDLFVRTSKGIQLTDFGQQFLVYAEPVNQQFQFLNFICKDILHAQRTAFSVSSPSFRFILEKFIEIYEKYEKENVSFSHKEDFIMNTLNDVETTVCDIGVVTFISSQWKTWSRLFNAKDLEYTRLSNEIPQVIVGEKNPLYHMGLTSVTSEQLEPYPFVIAHADIFYSSGKEEDGFDFIDEQRRKGRIMVSNRLCVYDVLLRTNAYSVCSNTTNVYKGETLYKKIKAIPLKHPGFTFEIGWVKKKNTQLSRVGMDFVDGLEQLFL